MKRIFGMLIIVGSLLMLVSMGASDLGCPRFGTILTVAMIGLIMWLIGLKGLKIIN